MAMRCCFLLLFGVMLCAAWAEQKVIDLVGDSTPEAVDEAATLLQMERQQELNRLQSERQRQRLDQEKELKEKNILEDKGRLELEKAAKEDEERKKQEEQQRKLFEARKRQQQEEQRKKQQEEQQRKKQEEAERKKKEEKNRSPYEVLGVNKDASQADIKKAYRALSLKFHPDKNPGCEESKAKFTKLVDAYEVLGDEDSRVLYDEETFGAYQSRPHNYNSKAGFYNGGYSLVTPLNVTEFDRLVQCQGDDECVPWMIKFYTPWCVHCKNLMPDWKRTASTMDGSETPLGFVRFGGVNCETEKSLCQRIGVRSYPTVFLFTRDRNGQQHVETFNNRKPRSVENLIDFAEKGIRLAHDASLQTLDAFLMHKNVTNSESVGLWIVLFEGLNCPACDTLKASLRRMSANVKNLANFGVLDCAKEVTICREQYVGRNYPVLKMYPYKGTKATGETLIESASPDPLVVLPVVEKVIRMCVANIEAETGLMSMLHEEDEYNEPEEPPKQQYQYPEPERQVHRGLPAGVKAAAGAHYIGGR